MPLIPLLIITIHQLKAELMRKDTLRKILITLAAILIPVVLLVAAIFLGISDTKIPPELTMRTGDFDYGLFDGVIRDISESSTFVFSKDYRSLLQSHLDPFFIIASFMPKSGAKVLLWFAYFLRFGLASLFMNRLLSKQLSFGNVFASLFGVIYSLSSAVLMMSSYTNAMNVIILIPIVLELLIEFNKNGHRLKDGLKLVLAMGFTILLAGDLALLYVVPFLICAIVFISACTASKFSKSLVSVICVIPYFVLALCIGAITIVNTFVSYDFAFEKETLKTFDFRITFFDLLTRFFAGKPLAADKFSPALYVTIFVLLAIIAFFINSKIPLRIRITFLSIVLLYHFSFSSRAWYLISVLFKNTSMPSEISANMRFACLTSLLIFAAAISLKNIHLLAKRELFACSVAIICFVIISNNSSANLASSTFAIYFTVLCAIVSYLMIANADKLDSKTIFAVVLFGMFIQMSFILPISSYASSLDVDSALFDSQEKSKTLEYPFEELNFFNKNENTYILLHNYDEIEGNAIEQINNIAYSAGIRTIFLDLEDCMSFFAGGRAPLINGEMSQEKEGKVESYVNIYLSANEMTSNIVAFSNHDGSVIMEVECGDNSYKNTYTSPVITVIDDAPMNFQVKFLTPRGELSNPNDSFDFYSVDNGTLGAFTSKIHKFKNSFIVEPATDGTNLYTVMTGRNFDKSIKVFVNGREVETKNIYGKLGFVLNPNIESVVEISSYNDDVIIFLAISIFVTVCSIVLMLLINLKGNRRADN